MGSVQAINYNSPTNHTLQVYGIQNTSPDSQNTSPDTQNTSPDTQNTSPDTQNTSPDILNTSPDTQMQVQT